MPRTTTSRRRAEDAAAKLSKADPSHRSWRSAAELRAIDEAVRAARAANYSWAAIGAVLGVSKQAAQQRFS